jgi:phasin
MDSKTMMEVPQQVRELAGTSVDQAEKAFGAFIQAANQSVAMIPAPAKDISKHVLSITEKNIQASFDHARKLIQAHDLQEIMQIQTEFLKTQFAAVTEQMKEFRPTNGGTSPF